MRNSTSTIRLIYISLSLFLVNSVQSQWTGNISNATKVCTAPSYQENSYTVPNGSSGAIVAWEDHRNGNYDIYIDNLSNAGSLLWSSAGTNLGRAVCTAAASQYINDLIIDAAGNTFVVWEDYRVSNTNEDVYIQKFNSSGVAQWAANGVPVVTSPNDQYGARMISDGAGGVIVAWGDYRNDPTNSDNPQTFAQRINSSGTPMWAINGISVYNSSILSFPADVVTDGSGGAIISLTDIRNSPLDANGDYTNIDIYAQRINASGGLLWGTNGTPVCLQNSNQYNGSFTTVPDGAGGAIFYWYDFRNDPGNGNTGSTNSDLFVQRLNGTGTPLWTTNGVTISTATQDVSEFKAISDGAGGAVAVWNDYFYNSSTGDYTSTLKTQRTSATGTNMWAANGITVSTFASSTYIDLALDNVGGVIYSWSADNVSAATSRIIANRINLATSAFTWPAGGVVVASNGSGAYNPKIATNLAGEAIIVWEDYRNFSVSDEDIYANKLNNNGTLPLLWGNITAYLKGNDGVISWQTLQELNTARFDVERSEDGNSFTTIASLAAAGNSTTSKTYEAFDKNLLKFTGKTFYYRIRQVDLDGNITFSKIVKLTIPKNAAYVKLLSNPVINEARLLYMADETGKSVIKIRDVNAKLVYSREETLLKGANQLNVDVQKLAAGTYFIEIVQGAFRQTVQMLK